MPAVEAKVGEVQLTFKGRRFEALGAEIGSALDVFLAHELTHVWQDQRFHAFREEGEQGASETDLARSAAVEGSAEFVAHEVARRLGVSKLLDRIGPRRRAGEEAWEAERLWPYRAGLQFVETVHAALGPTETWRRLFEGTPRTAWEVEHPGGWIRGEEAPTLSLDDWVDRLAWCLGQPTATSPAEARPWSREPLLQAELAARLRVAGLSTSSDPWADCRGGLLLEAKPLRGALAGKTALVFAWRFASPDGAQAARLSLERAADALGFRGWAEVQVGEALGPVRLRVHSNGASVRTGAYFGEAGASGREASWAVQVHEGVLLEVLCWGGGTGPALLDVIDTAARAWREAEEVDAARAGAPASASPWAELAHLRAAPPEETASGVLPADVFDRAPPLRDELLARHLAQPGGEARVLSALLARAAGAAAWIAALGPGAGSESVEDADRNALLEAALGHGEADVQRFALEALGDHRCKASPWAAGVVEELRRAVGHDDPAVRAMAVYATSVQVDEDILTDAEVELLLRDPSPAVRWMMAICKRLLGERTQERLEVLGGDEHPVVRQMARAQAQAEQRGSDVHLLLDSMFHRSGQDSAALLDRVRRALHGGNSAQQSWALLALQHLDEKRAHFLPDLVHALTRSAHRDSALPALLAGGLDLRPALPSLLSMLKHPRWRPDVLRVLAANDVLLPRATLEQARAWEEAGDATQRCAAALLLLRVEAAGRRPLDVLEEVWKLVPPDWRPAIVAAAAARRPSAEPTQRLRQLALSSPFPEVRLAASSNPGRGYDEALLGTLLDRVQQVGPTAASECWRGFIAVAAKLHVDGRRQAGDLLARYLNRWCDEDRLPRLNAAALTWHVLADFGPSQACVEALDRCLVRDGVTYLQLSLVQLRNELQVERYPESDEVRAALDRHYAVEPPLEGLAARERSGFTDELAGRPSVSTETVLAVLKRAASDPWEDLELDVEALLKGRPERIAAALPLVPGLLDRDTRSSVEIGISILESSGPAAGPSVPQLRDLLPRALPSWRTRVEACITAIEAAPAGLETKEPVATRRRPSWIRPPKETNGMPGIAYVAGGAVLVLLIVFERRRARRARDRRSSDSPPSGAGGDNATAGLRATGDGGAPLEQPDASPHRHDHGDPGTGGDLGGGEGGGEGD